MNSLESSIVKLCAAVEKYECLHDSTSYGKYARPECKEAWQMVANECDGTVDFCMKRWKTLRRCFFEGVKRPESKYYFHDHLKFLQFLPKRNSVEESNDEASSRHNCCTQKSEIAKTVDNNVAKSVGSRTKRTVESNEIMHQTKSTGLIITEGSKKKAFEADQDLLEETPVIYKRSCKRHLDESTEDERAEETSYESEKHKPKLKFPSKSVRVRMKKLKINIIENKAESNKDEMVDNFTDTGLQKTRDFGTQYELNSSDFDGIFTKSAKDFISTECEPNSSDYDNILQKSTRNIGTQYEESSSDLDAIFMKSTREVGTQYEQSSMKSTKDTGTQHRQMSPDCDDTFISSIKTHLTGMNARQKMNFKRKTYQSLFEVYDDPNDFPNSDEPLPLPLKQTPCVVDTPIGELRSERELVSVIQAAKSRPEIMNAKNEVKASEPAQSKPTINMPLSIVDTSSKAGSSHLHMSISPDNNDLQYLIDNIDEDDDIPLPSSWDEIRAKPTDASKVTAEEDYGGISHSLLQNLVSVSGPSGGTVVTRDGDKKRIYRIFHKFGTLNGKQLLPTKNGNSSDCFPTSSAKTMPDTKRNGAVRTDSNLYNKNPQDTVKVSNVISNISERSLNDKPIRHRNETSNSTNIGSQPTSSNSINNGMIGQTMIKNCRKVTTTTPSSVPKISSPSKVMITKLPITPVLPLTSNVTKNRIQVVRAEPQTVQRKYSMSDSLSSEITNTCLPTSTISKKLGSTNNGNPQFKSNISHIQISQPVSLNIKTRNAQTSSSTHSIFSNTSATSAASAKNIKHLVQYPETPEEPVSTTDNVPLDMEALIDATICTNMSKQYPQKTSLQINRTAVDDDWDPLIDQSSVKSEPMDE